MPPFTRRSKSQSPSTLTAAAMRIPTGKIPRSVSSTVNGAWQDQLWQWRDSVGEYRFGTDWKASAVSRAVLYVSDSGTDTPDPQRIDDGSAVDALNALFNGPGGQAQMLKSIALHLTVPGEGYIVGYTDQDGQTRWAVSSLHEVKRRGETVTLDRGDGQPVQLTSDDWILRIWNPSPVRFWDADSPSRALLPVLRELDELTKKVFAAIDSRLAGNGMILWPQEMSFPTSIQEGIEDDPTYSFLTKAMTTPIQDRDSASAVVPIIAEGPAEYLDKVRHLLFAHDLDGEINSLRESCIRRIALGLDMPPEVLLGIGSANHWSAWALEEHAVKLHIEPMLATICDALTTGYLWPILGEEGRRYSIWFDSSELTERPDRGPDADALFDRGELSADALRRHHGFNDEEAPSPEERRERILLDIAKTNPQLAPAILALLGVASPRELDSAVTVESSRRAPLALPAESSDGGNVPPDMPVDVLASAGDDVAFSAVVACDVAVTRVLDVVGKKIRSSKFMRSQQGALQPIQPWLIHTHYPVKAGEIPKLIEGAWEVFKAAAPELSMLQPALEEYVSLLLEHGLPHERTNLMHVIRRAVRDASNGPVAL